MLTFKSYFSKIITGGFTLIAASILSGIGTDAWSSIKNWLVDPSLLSSISSWQIISYMLGGFGILLVGLAILQKKKLEKTLSLTKSSYKKNTNESKLDQVLHEIEFFIERWNTRYFLKMGYRRDIELKTIWKNVPKIRKHSQQIKIKLKLLRDSNSRYYDTWNSTDEIADRIAKLGVDVESIFQHKLVKEVKKTPQDKINQLLSDGDKICIDSKFIILQLEKLRGVLD